MGWDSTKTGLGRWFGPAQAGTEEPGGLTSVGGWRHRHHHRSPVDLPTSPGPRPGRQGDKHPTGAVLPVGRGDLDPTAAGTLRDNLSQDPEPVQVRKLRPEAHPLWWGRDRAPRRPALSLWGGPPAPRGSGGDPNTSGPRVTAQRDRGSVLPPLRGTERPRGGQQPPNTSPTPELLLSQPLQHRPQHPDPAGATPGAGNAARADPAASARAGTAPVTGDSRGPPQA